MNDSIASFFGSLKIKRAIVLQSAFFFSLLFCATLSKAQSDGFTNYFNHNNGTTYNKSLASQDMGSVEYWNNSWNSDIQDNNLRIRFARGDFGTNAGMISRTRMNGSRTYSVEYRLKFDNGFDFRLGGKIPGLAGGSAPSGGGRPTDGKGFSTRFMWRQGGKLVVYAYYRDQVNFYGDDWETGVYMTPGQWYTIKEEVTVNTGGNYNGTVKVWVNGVERLNRTGLRLMTQNNTVDVMYMDCFMGGNDPSWSPDHTQYLRMDNFVCVKGGGSTTPPPPAANDDLSSITSPGSISQGETSTVTVNYETSTSRDIVVSFKKDASPWTRYSDDVRVSVGAGSGSVNVNVPTYSSTPVANDDYQFQAYLTTSGGNWNDRLDFVSKTDIDVIASGPSASEITSISSPGTVTVGETATGISIDYAATTNRDIQVLFQLAQSPWTVYGSATYDVTAGTGTINAQIPVDANTPLGSNYKFMAFITTDGGGWNDRFDNKENTGVNVVSAGPSEDEITSVSAPGVVTVGETLTGVSVDYAATTSRDIQVLFQLGQSPWTVYGSATYSVSAGTGTINAQLDVDANTPVASGNYKVMAFITTAGGNWGDRFDYEQQTGVDAVVAGGSSGGGNGSLVNGGIYRVKNVWGGVYLHANGDSDGSSAVLKDLNTGWWTQQWIVENVSGNTYRLKCRWGETYLSETSTYNNVELKTSAVTSTSFEVEEVAGEANTFRLKGNSGDYLHANGSTDGSSITTFPLETAWGSQKWVLEYDANARKVQTSEVSSAVIYPTVIPEGGQFTLLSDVDGSTANIFNMSGQQVLSNKVLSLTKGENRVNVSGLERGLYFIKTSFSSDVIRFAIQ